MKRRLFFVLLALTIASVTGAQNTAWLHLPDSAPRISAFVHPAGLDPSEVGILLFCEQGGFLPMLSFGNLPALAGASQVWVETLHSDQLGAGNYWQYDPVRHRAIPLADINAVVLAQALFEGGTLRVRASRHANDAERAVYNFSGDEFRGLVSELPCLLSALEGTYIDRWSWDEVNQAVIGGRLESTMVILHCRGPQQPALTIRSAEALDPRMDAMLVFIANVDPTGAFWFNALGEGQYEGDANPAVRILMHLTQDPPFPLVMLGLPAPFAMLGLGNLVDVLGNLPCVTVSRN